MAEMNKPPDFAKNATGIFSEIGGLGIFKFIIPRPKGQGYRNLKKKSP